MWLSVGTRLRRITVTDCPPYDADAPLPDRMNQLRERLKYWHGKVLAATEDNNKQ